ncbi:hypothetical protein P5V15_007847 [Pogonomyrmex californicus]
MSDSEIDQNFYDSDQDVSEHHSKLVDAVAQLDKRQRVKKAERSEPSLEVSEYHLVKSGVTDKDAVCVKDLIKSLGKKGDQINVIKRLRYIQQKNKILPKPLEKPAAERIKRTVGFEKVQDELKKWESVVTRNRTAECLSFPLKRSAPIKDNDTSKIPKFLKGFNIKSDLMKKFEEVDPTLLNPPAEEEEKVDKYKMTMEEMLLRRKEAARIRAQQSYKEAKAHRQRKIKSKKFHRIQRKDKLKQQLKDFEKLKDTNPQEALTKLEQLDKTRAEERMSLRHKNTGQWAKNKQIRAKYDKETRQELAEQLAISRELTQKVKRTDSDEEDEEDENDEINMKDIEDEEDEMQLENDKKTEGEIDEFIKLCRTYYDKKEQMKEEKTDKISDKILSAEEKETACHNEKNNISQINISDSEIKNKKSCDKKKSNISQASNKKSKLHSKQKNSISQNTNNKESTSVCNDVDVMSVQNIQKETTKNKRIEKKSKSQDVGETFDSEKTKKGKSKRKLNSKMQKVKKKLKTNKTEKCEEEKEKEKENEDYLPNLEFKNPKQKPILDFPLEETTSRENVQKNNDLTSLRTIANTVQKTPGINHEVEIDPKKYVNIKPKHLKTQLPDISTAGDEDSEQEEEERHKIMSEAFADDDVVEEFTKEQEEEMEKSQPQNIDLSLPGWGSWGGPNVKKSKIARKKSRFILNIPKIELRKPENQGKVIVFEHDNEKLKKHLVKELPYPFTKVKDFEASIRAPVSKNFVPMNAHLRLIRPTVSTKLGQVIEPMDENELVKNQPIVKKPPKRLINKKNKNKKNRIVKNDSKKKGVQNV